MADRIDIQNVLAQMRHLKAELNQQASPLLSPFIERVDQLRNQDRVAPSAIKNSPLNQSQVNAVGHSYPYGSVNPNTPSFNTMFRQAIDHVNGQQAHAGQLAERFELGDPKIDLPEVMVALQKASISFQAMTEVRNKLVEAYKDIMNMPI